MYVKCVLGMRGRRVPRPAVPRRAGHAGGDPARGGRDAGLWLLTLMQSGRWEGFGFPAVTTRVLEGPPQRQFEFAA